MSQEIVKVEGLDVYQLAQSMATAGYWADVKNPGQALAKILCGYELGFGPVASLSGIHIIDGKPTIGAHLIAAQIRRSGRYDYRVDQLTDGTCRIMFLRTVDGVELGISEYSIADARRANLFGRKAQNWEKNPRNMLFARAISNGVKWYCPEVLLGAYATEEMEEERSQRGREETRPERPQEAQGEPEGNPAFEDAEFSVDPAEGNPPSPSKGFTVEEALRLTIERGTLLEGHIDVLREEMKRRLVEYGWTKPEFFHLLKQYDYEKASDIEAFAIGLIVLDLESEEDLQSIRRERAEITAAEMEARAGFTEGFDPSTGEVSSLDEEFQVDRSTGTVESGDALAAALTGIEEDPGESTTIEERTSERVSALTGKDVKILHVKTGADASRVASAGVDAATAAVAKRRARKTAPQGQKLIEDKPETPAAMME